MGDSSLARQVASSARLNSDKSRKRPARTRGAVSKFGPAPRAGCHEPEHRALDPSYRETPT